MKRREFIKNTGIITAGSLLIPSFLRAEMFGGNDLGITKKRLVIIQLSGGNDGLNTFVPYGLDEYYNNRTAINLASDNLLKLTNKFGLHPSLTNFQKFYDKGYLSILNSVGYPNPSRSHFRSMDIWHTASDTNEYLNTGWIGRYLDNNCQHAYEAVELNGKLSLALKGENLSGIALTNPQAFYNSIHSDFYETLEAPETHNNELQFLYKTFQETKDSAAYIFEKYKLKENRKEYDGLQFGQKLKQISTLIHNGIDTPVFYAELSGFDTHVNQNAVHERLLQQLNDGLGSFVDDLEENDTLKDTTILVFSEFGRRLKENASRGTDHGAANVSFIIDTQLKKEAHSYHEIDLNELNDGDPIHKIDFRSIYQEILSETIGVNPQTILKKEYAKLNLF